MTDEAMKDLFSQVNEAIKNARNLNSDDEVFSSLEDYLDEFYGEEQDPETFGKFVIQYKGSHNTQGVGLRAHDGQSLIRVVNINGQDFGQTGYYSSHGGTEFYGEWNEVELAQKTIDYWKNK